MHWYIICIGIYIYTYHAAVMLNFNKYWPMIPNQVTTKLLWGVPTLAQLKMWQDGATLAANVIGGTYHIQGLCKGYILGYTPKNMALYGTVPPC